MKHVSEIKEKKRRENLLISNQIYNDRFDNWRRPLNLNPNVIFDNNLMIDCSITISDGCYPKLNAELVSSQRQPCGMYEERSKAQWKLHEKDFKDIADGYDSKNEIYESKSEDSFDSEYRYASRKSQNSKKSLILVNTKMLMKIAESIETPSLINMMTLLVINGTVKFTNVRIQQHKLVASIISQKLFRLTPMT